MIKDEYTIDTTPPPSLRWHSLQPRRYFIHFHPFHPSIPQIAVPHLTSPHVCPPAVSSTLLYSTPLSLPTPCWLSSFPNPTASGAHSRNGVMPPASSPDVTTSTASQRYLPPRQHKPPPPNLPSPGGRQGKEKKDGTAQRNINNIQFIKSVWS